MRLSQLRPALKKLKAKMLFGVLSGAHAYGFASPDSDLDLRACHVLPTKALLGLRKPRDIIERKLELEQKAELVSYELEKFLSLMLKPNGNVLENLFAPLVIVSSQRHARLKVLAKHCICKAIYHHYRGLAWQIWSRFVLKPRALVKHHLYVLRALMAGIYVLERGKIVPDMLALNRKFKLQIIDRLIELKRTEKAALIDRALEKESKAAIEMLFRQLDQARAMSRLPERANPRPLDRFLIKIRLEEL